MDAKVWVKANEVCRGDGDQKDREESNEQARFFCCSWAPVEPFVFAKHDFWRGCSSRSCSKDTSHHVRESSNRPHIQSSSQNHY